METLQDALFEALLEVVDNGYGLVEFNPKELTFVAEHPWGTAYGCIVNDQVVVTHEEARRS